MIKKIYKWLTTRYELTIRDNENFSEKKIIKFNYSKIIFISFIISLAWLTVSIFLIRGVLSKFCNPIHFEKENQKKLIQLNLFLDSLEQKVQQQKRFIQSVQKILKEDRRDNMDKNLSLDSFVEVNKGMEKRELSNIEEENTVLGKQKIIFTDPIKPTAESKGLTKKEIFISPISSASAIISSPFDANINHFGIDIIAREKEPIKAIADGKVIFSSWTLETGWVIIIQHQQNVISIYKHNSLVLKNTGSFVKKADIIAIIGNSGELSTGPHLHFEIWCDNIPINPEEVLNF